MNFEPWKKEWSRYAPFIETLAICFVFMVLGFDVDAALVLISMIYFRFYDRITK